MTGPEQTAWGEPLLDAQGLADALGMSRRWVYEQVEGNGLPCYRIGRALLFEVAAVRAWLAGFKAGDWPAQSEEERCSTHPVSGHALSADVSR